MSWIIWRSTQKKKKNPELNRRTERQTEPPNIIVCEFQVDILLDYCIILRQRFVIVVVVVFYFFFSFFLEENEGLRWHVCVGRVRLWCRWIVRVGQHHQQWYTAVLRIAVLKAFCSQKNRTLFFFVFSRDEKIFVHFILRGRLFGVSVYLMTFVCLFGIEMLALVTKQWLPMQIQLKINFLKRKTMLPATHTRGHAFATLSHYEFKTKQIRISDIYTYYISPLYLRCRCYMYISLSGGHTRAILIA